MKGSYETIISEAGIDSGEHHRWWLFRLWNFKLPLIIWIMMNPSTADYRKNDPTIMKIMRYASRWGFGAVLVLNIYAFRTSKPENLPQKEKKRRGSRNNWWIRLVFRHAAKHDTPVICAWGNSHKERGDEVRRMAADAALELQCLEVSLNGEPRHPRFLPEDQTFRPL